MDAQARNPVHLGPWLFGRNTDLLTFAGSAVLALGLVALGRALGFGGGALPEWGWIAFVLAVDVAHVYATGFRTYFDGDELRRHPLRYVLLPVAVYCAGVALYQQGSLTFWRVLAYAAVFHFVRQQAGWVALYRARARVEEDRTGTTLGPTEKKQLALERVVEDAAIYASMLFPLFYWHAHLDEVRFAWFVAGDFVASSEMLEPLVPFALGASLLAYAAYAALETWRFLRFRRIHLGKNVVVVTTAAIWHVGIVLTNADFDFTVTNVVVHGVPYVVLLWAYAKARAQQKHEAVTAQVVRRGLGAFVAVLLVLAFAEEWLWHLLVWPDHALVFGDSHMGLSRELLAWVVPLLALPQATHYVLDGVLWRRKDTAQSRAQRVALGFASV